MSYESPIEFFTDTVGHYWSEQNDELVMKEVVRVGVTVDKDELIKALSYDRDQYEKGFHDGMMANKWISTEDRLPENELPVLATVGRYFGKRIAVVKYIDGCWYSAETGLRLVYCAVDAWMPLPELYKERGDTE